MKRLTKMAYELRDVTIFYERMIEEHSVDGISFVHKRSKSRIRQILKIQKERFSHFIKSVSDSDKQLFVKLIFSKYVMQRFYHYEIGLILQRYYIRMKKK